MASKEINRKNKISQEFASRLNRFGEKQKVHAIVLLGTRNKPASNTRRQTTIDRKSAIKSTRASAGKALGDIDGVLKEYGGRRLAKSPNALGSIPVETTPRGIKALASLQWVKAIVEDQSIHLLS